jgi:MFS family permease
MLPAPFIYLSPTVPTAMAAVFVSTLIWSMWFAPQTTILTALVGSRSRAVAWAVFSAVLLVVGQGFGPPLIGALSDLLEPRFGIHSLRYAMLTGIVFQAWGALHFYLAGRTLIEDYERASSH